VILLPSVALEDVKGIGEKTLKTLRNANIDSVQKLAKMSIKDLTRIKGIGQTSAKKFITGAKALLRQPLETITSDLAKSVVSRQDMSIVKDLQAEIAIIHRKLDQFNQRLENIEKKVINGTESMVEVSENQFFRILKTSYNALDKKFGSFVLISDLTKKIKDSIPWSTERIHKQLYTLFLNYKVELQPGKIEEGAPLMQDGKKFVWFKLK
jgi:NAD-dependent DNA ligase